MALTQIDDRGLKTPIDLIDNEKIRLGTGNDLEIYHNGTHGYVQNTVDGQDLNLISTKDLYLKTGDGSTGTHTVLYAADNAGVELRYDNSKKIETTTSGVAISGVLSSNQTSGQAISIGDTAQINLGNGDDLKIYHDGSHSNIINTTGNLYINASASDTAIACKPDGAVELYHNNVKKIETYTSGVEVIGNLWLRTANGKIQLNDDIKLSIGNNDDLQIYHNGSSGKSIVYHSHASGVLSIAADHLNLADWGNEHPFITCDRDGAVEIYHDNVKKLATGSGGIIVSGNSYMDDNNKLIVGSDNDLQIYYDGTHSYIKAVGASCGGIIIDNSADADQNISLLAGQDIYLKVSDGTETAIRCERGGSVDLYYDNAQKLETMSNGVGLDGDSSACAIRLKSDGSIRGYFYADANSSTGHLNNSGAWKFRVEDDGDYQFYGSSISDRDKKDNIATVTGTSLDKITKLVPKTYNWKNLDGITPTDKTFTGFIAQEVKEHLPSLVTGTDGQKNMAVDYNGILAYAVKAITELSAEVETLKTKVAALEAA